MANNSFSFKQFTIWHDKCAMKVGTDGVLVGAWAKVKGASNILDIGCGTGLIALMAAQRNATARITGIDIDESACKQADENISRSPWSDRIRIVHTDANAFVSDFGFDSIISNPPFFQHGITCPDEQRTTARHTESFTFVQLLDCVNRLLTDDGTFSVIIPFDSRGSFVKEALSKGLHVWRDTQVHTKPGKAPKRILLSFGRKPTDIIEYEHLTIETDHHSYTEAYRELTHEFYLKM